MAGSRQGSFSVLVILLATVIVGLRVLSIVNISLDVFRVVGGVIIAYMGADMLRVVIPSARDTR